MARYVNSGPSALARTGATALHEIEPGVKVGCTMRRLSWVLAVTLTLAFGAACGGSGSRSGTKPRATTTVPPVTTVTPSTVAPVLPEQWRELPDAPVWLGRYDVWTGNELISGTAGCCDGMGTNDVVAYSPATGRWRALASFPLTVRNGEVAVWTGHEMVVVGGTQAASPADTSISNAVATTTGAALDPALNRWRVIAPMPAPMDRPDGAVWTGHEVLVLEGSRLLRYDPAANTWSSGAAMPFSRGGTVAVWTGTELIVWGGSDVRPVTATSGPPRTLAVHADGAAYDPVGNRWRAVPAAPVPARTLARGVWTGSAMVVWGGIGADGTTGTGDRGLLGKGAAYDPAANTWRALPASPLSARLWHVMVWTGHEVVVWGGTSRGGTEPRDGAAYDPATNAWRALPTAPRTMLTADGAAWTGQWVLLVGGYATTTQAVGPAALAYAPGR